MRRLWQAIAEVLWPSRIVRSSSRSRRMTLLQLILALAITLASGPEIFAAMEMTALLEILGAGLFIAAYVAGFKLKGFELWQALQSTVSPVGQLVVLRSNAPATLRVVAAASALLNVAWCIGAVIVLGAFGQHLYMQVA